MTSVAIIGAGFGGLGAAISLRRAGFTDLVVLEKSQGLGGVWRENTYPNAACDVPSALYSWSFAPNPAWGRRYSPQPEILDYMERTAAEEDILDVVRTGVEVKRCTWQDAQWLIETSDGQFRADVLLPAVGQLSRPVVPDLPGRETFAGPAFHSAQWRHDVDLRGKRVAVVGTGASAIQFVPGIVDDVASMVIFQRHAPYVIPKPDGDHGRVQHFLTTRVPGFARLERAAVYGLTELMNHMLIADAAGTRALTALWRGTLRAQVPDAGLRRKLTPDYPIGCKRLLFSNDWYPALARRHVHVETSGILGVEPGGVRAADGVLHQADVIIYGTGFAATDFLSPIEVLGRDSRPLEEEWADGAHAHLGITVPDFPNMFLLYGPNTNLGGSSIIAMMEAQTGYVIEALRLVESGREMVVRREASEAWDAEMQQRLRDSVWAHCDNWYRTSSGRITTNWPGQVSEYKHRTRHLDPGDFE